nr:molybdenum cofactor guanylyltransferase [uncultured Capnocytophaga sp.]
MKAIVLAGGKSSRMGQDKALLPFQGKPLLAHIAHILESAGYEVYIAGKKPIYDVFPYLQIADIYPDKGPLGGVYSALTYLKEDILVCPCDMPFINAHLLSFLLSNADYSKINVLTYAEKVYPTLGIYPYIFTTKLQEYITQNKLKMLTLLQELKAQLIPYPQTPDANSYFKNVNTPQDWKNLGTISDQPNS